MLVIFAIFVRFTSSCIFTCVLNNSHHSILTVELPNFLREQNLAGIKKKNYS